MAKIQKKKIAYSDTLPDVRILPISSVHLNPDNPKKPLSADRKKGLNTNLDKFGMCSPILVALHPDLPGEFIILDGNTRYEEMEKRGHEKIPVQVLSHIKTWTEIKEFVITYDRNVKAYNEDIVERQLLDLIEAGEDIEMLASLANIPNLEDILNGEVNAGPSYIDTTSIDEQDTILITGPKTAIEAIRALVKKVKGKMDNAVKMQKILAELDSSLPEDEDELLLLMLVAAAHLFGALTKTVIPFVSTAQKDVVFRKVKEFIEHEQLSGDFAVSRALEYMLADYEIGGGEV